MTWNEWVSEVERQMREKGIRPDEAEIFYIEAHDPRIDEVSVRLEPSCGLVVGFE